MEERSYQQNVTSVLPVTEIGETCIDLELGTSSGSDSHPDRQPKHRTSGRSNSLTLTRMTEQTPMAARATANPFALIALGFATCASLVFLWCYSTPEKCPANQLSLMFFSRVVCVGGLLFVVWWTQRDRAKRVVTTIHKKLPRYAQRLPRIIIRIEHHDENEDADLIVSEDKILDRVLRPLSTKSSAISEDDFISCFDARESGISGLSPSMRNSESAALEESLFPRVPQVQRAAALKHLEDKHVYMIRDVAGKLSLCDKEYCDALKQKGVKDPYGAIAEFGSHSNGYDIGAFRFLSSSGWNMKIAETRLMDTIRWRTVELPKYMANPNFLNELVEKRLLPNIGWDEKSRGCLAIDKSPLEYWAIQAANLKYAFSVLGDQGIKCGYVQYLEARADTVKKFESLGMFVVIDCSNVSMSTLMWQASYFKKFISFVSATGEVHYPECMTKCVLANAPSFVDIIWKIAKAALSQATKDKILITSSTDAVEENCDMRDIEHLKETILAIMR
eukprot:GEMP01010240.1.p1 GENE.GEMP01010240.1~~GEMP01010240.1.p1  ORF type:complete len:505 (+),score=77.74 GEMP01010240.1:52-1566(+)